MKKLIGIIIPQKFVKSDGFTVAMWIMGVLFAMASIGFIKWGILLFIPVVYFSFFADKRIDYIANKKSMMADYGKPKRKKR